MPGSCLKVVIHNCSVLTCHTILSLGLFLLHETEICSKQNMHWPLLFILHWQSMHYAAALAQDLTVPSTFQRDRTYSHLPHKSCLATPGQLQHTRLDYTAACPLLTQAPSKSHTLLSTPTTTRKTQGWATQPQEATCPSRQGLGRFDLFALISVC